MSTAGRLRFTLLGTGSSGGVPRIGNDWGVCDSSEPKNRRRRCSALLEFSRDPLGDEATRVLIDTSPDLREQLLSAGVDNLDAVFITHDHADQTHGLDDLRALALRSRKRIAVHMDEFTAKTLTKKFSYCFEGSGGYPPIIEQQPYLTASQVRPVRGQGGRVDIMPLRQVHGAIHSLGFRVGNLAYCNDVSELPEDTLSALKDLDVFVVDALRYTPHPTHAHLERTLEWIAELKPKRSILTNLHIDMDYATLCQELPEGVEPGFDGMTVTLEYSHDK